MRKHGPKGGIAFITLMLSAMALDSDNMILPGVICLVSALQLLRTSLREEPYKRKEPVRGRLKPKQINVSVLIIAQGKEKSNTGGNS